MAALGLPEGSAKEKAAKHQAVQDATKRAIEIPFRVMQVAHDSMAVIKAMAETGNPNSVSDAGVAAIAARSGVMGAYLNVKINAGGVKDKEWVEDILIRGREIQDQAVADEKAILEIVERNLN